MDDLERQALEEAIQLEEDAAMAGINPEDWGKIKNNVSGRYVQDDLPNFAKAEAEAREANIPQEAKDDFNNRLSLRWIKYHQLAKDKDKQMTLARQYRMISHMHRSR